MNGGEIKETKLYTVDAGVDTKNRRIMLEYSWETQLPHANKATTIPGCADVERLKNKMLTFFLTIQNQAEYLNGG